MGLPEGSIRAVIALSLIVLFAILAVFLFEGVSGPVNTVENLSDDQRAQFMKDHATARDTQSYVARDKEGKPLMTQDGKNLYTITYRSESNQTSADFAKQLLVLLGTLMTAITSFYLGAGTVTSAVAQTTNLAKPSPSRASIIPSTHSIATDGGNDSFFCVAKHLMDRGAILLHARDIELGFANIDADTHNW